jgi:uncharacterized protein
MTDQRQFFPGRAPIDAYGNGGFRFADMSHRGSLLLLPSGIYGWPVMAPGELTVDALAERDQFDFLLLGTGATQIFPASDIRRALEDAGLGLEIMSTGAAARTYNVLLAEKRAVAAALMAVA